MTERSQHNRQHVVILDGTLSSLDPGFETNAGLFYKLLYAGRFNQTIYYEPGIQWDGWNTTRHVITGIGTNRMIRRSYGAVASRYRPGDRIYLFGYSRGADAARSLAGIVDRVGLLRAEHAIPRRIQEIYRFYQTDPDGPAAREFARRYCHPRVEIEMVGLWDTVKALGLRLPILWRYTESYYAFHNDGLGNVVRNGFHALAMDETRRAYAPVMWTCPAEYTGHMEQVWFRGAHGDIGGQLDGFETARGLANIPLVWITEKAEFCGLALPQGWRERFPLNPDAPSVGTLRGWGKFFWSRRRRIVGGDPSESIHPNARNRPARVRRIPAMVRRLAGVFRWSGHLHDDTGR